MGSKGGAGGPQKLRFTIQSVSGEDSDYPVRELLFHSPQTRGWVSPRFCKYPQEIVLRLESPSKIHQIQILSHEFKIATKIELFAGIAATGQDPLSSMKRLGYLSFDANERSNHQARELKSVHLTTPAFLVRLVIHRCWVNRLNIYNQVGIIALNLIGESLADLPEAPPYPDNAGPPRDAPYYNQGGGGGGGGGEGGDQGADMHVDSVTGQKIRELLRTKDAAVAREDYDEAKRIKESIDRLKVMGQKIAQLEARKRAAVDREDYDDAKLIKADMDKLRAAGESGAAIPDNSRASADQAYSRAAAQRPPSRQGGGSMGGDGGGGSMGADAGGTSMGGGRSQAGSVAPTPVGTRPVPFDEQPLRPAADGAYGGYGPDSPNGNGGETSGNINSKNQAYDDRPAQGRGKYTPSGEDREAAMAVRAAPPAASNNDTSGAPDGWPRDLPGPDELTGNSSKDAEPLEELESSYVAKAMFSKNWQLREAALNFFASQATGGKYADKREAFRTLVRAVQRGLSDKVAGVYLASLALLAALLEALGTTAGGKELTSACEMVLPAMLEKMGDTNVRLRDASREAVMTLAHLPEGGLKSATHVLVRPVKSQAAWRPVLQTLQLLQDLVPVLGISKTGDGFELGELMEFVNKAFTSANADVRGAAVKVVKESYDLVGPPLRKFLPKDLPVKVKEQLDAALGADAPAAPPPPPAPAPRAAAAKAPAKGAAAKKAAAPAAAAAPPPPPPRATSAANSRAATPQAAAGKRVATPPVAAAAPAAAADDPAPFLAELKSREAAVGKMHPDVAETCGNLAILYNQKGQYDKALPLYERALKIYEKHHGADHPEVAHTLTDLAVLHLEQGRDTVGRPLLERALRIQEAALGPDHPDVLAIKDVLNSE